MGVAVIVPDGHSQLVAHVGPGGCPEADGVQVVVAVPVVVDVEIIVIQVVPVQRAVPGVEHSVELVIVPVHEKLHGFQHGPVAAELLVGLLKAGDPEVHRAAGGHPEHDVGGVRGDAGEGDGAGNLVAVYILGGVGHAEAVGGAGDKVDVIGQIVVGVAARQGVLLAVVIELSTAAGGFQLDAGEAALPGESLEHGVHLVPDFRAHQHAAGGARRDGGVLPRGVQLVDGGVGHVLGDGAPGKGRQYGLIPVAGIGGVPLHPAHEAVTARDAVQRRAAGSAGGIAVFQDLLRGVGRVGAHPVGDGVIVG